MRWFASYARYPHLRNIQGAAVDALRSRFNVWFSLISGKSRRCSPTRCRNAAPFRAQPDTVTAALIDAAPELLVIGRAGVGLDNVDFKHAEKAGTVVSFTPDQNAISVAEIAIGMMLSLARFIPAADVDTKKGNWNRQALCGYRTIRQDTGHHRCRKNRVPHRTPRNGLRHAHPRLRSIPQPQTISC